MRTLEQKKHVGPRFSKILLGFTDSSIDFAKISPKYHVCDTSINNLNGSQKKIISICLNNGRRRLYVPGAMTTKKGEMTTNLLSSLDQRYSLEY